MRILCISFLLLSSIFTLNAHLKDPNNIYDIYECLINPTGCCSEILLHTEKQGEACNLRCAARATLAAQYSVKSNSEKNQQIMNVLFKKYQSSVDNEMLNKILLMGFFFVHNYSSDCSDDNLEIRSHCPSCTD